MKITLSKNKSIYIFSNISTLDVSLSIKHLGVMLRSGLGIEESIIVLATQTPDERIRLAYAGILENMHSGKTLAESMKEHKKIFSDIVVSIIAVGEEGATLEKNLNFLAEYLKKDYELQRKIKGALFYPFIVLALTVAELIGVIYFILPKLENLFMAFEGIPAFTLFVMNAARFFRNNVIFIVIGIVVVIFTINRLLKTTAGKKFKDRVALNFPILKKLNKNIVLTYFARTLGALLESGIPLERGLSITQSTVNNSLYAKKLERVQEELKTGKNLSASLAAYPKYFPVTYVKLIEIGEQTGTLEENLDYLYELYSEDVTDMTNNLATVIEPLLLIFVGLMIGGLALLIIAPIYQLTGSINA